MTEGMKDEEDQYSSSSHDEDEGGLDGQEGGHVGDAKRPRLRLAHACDRCRKRKIRCDTQQPCGPCQAARHACTFNTPSRRQAKPKMSFDGAPVHGIKRPHSPNGLPASLAGLAGLTGQGNLEARLAALEAMLGDVPPKVHNAFLSSLDARLGSGTGVGLKEGKGEGVSVALEALSGSNASFDPALSNFGSESNKWTRSGAQTLAPEWSAATSSLLRGLAKKDDIGDVAKKMEGMSFFYEDEIGQAKWQGATSGFPLLDLLTATNAPTDDAGIEAPTDTLVASAPTESPMETLKHRDSFVTTTSGNQDRDSSPSTGQRTQRFFPDRTPRPHQTLNPEASWKVITGVIPPDLMDTLVRCYLSTSHLLWPFLHVPSFLRDYANPQQWGEPGFACFIVAVCTLSSRHVDDPRVRANSQDPSTAGKQYFELFKRLRDLPSADRPTLYSIQAAFLAAVYAFGLGNLSKAFALQAESITLCLDGGLHRSVDGYDHFDAVEKETRKRTFWAIYSWDKQSAALFGRPAIIHLRDCDVTEPIIVDDENLTAEGVKEQANEGTSRICAFVSAIRLHVILEGVIDAATSPSSFPTSPFLARASATIARRSPINSALEGEMGLLEEWEKLLPKYWAYDTETAQSRDPIRITQAERLHCLQHLVKMIIYRHRFSGFVSAPAATVEDRAEHMEYCRKAMQCALTIVADHVHISQRGMMTYYGVHVIHQLAQAGRTLVAVVLNCRNADFRPLIAPSIEGLRSCLGLLRRFSGRYLCGLRSADIIDEFCRICNIPIDSPRVPDGTGRPSPAWLRPVRKRNSPSPSVVRGNSDSPAAMLELYQGQDIMSAPPNMPGQLNITAKSPELQVPPDLESLFNTSDYLNLNAMSPSQPGNTLLGLNGDGGAGSGGNDSTWDYNMAGFGGELLAGEGMDTVSDGLRGDENQGLSAATILSLLEEGSFDYGSIFTDQAPLPT